jgi:hypothetical protein
MASLHRTVAVAVAALVLASVTTGTAEARSFGQVIDDTVILVRDAAPVGVQAASTGIPYLRMGTVRVVDRAAGVIVLTDGTIVRLTPSALVRRGNERLTFDQIVPGSELVIRTVPPEMGDSAAGSALPGPSASPTVYASEISVVWVPGTLR